MHRIHAAGALAAPGTRQEAQQDSGPERVQESLQESPQNRLPERLPESIPESIHESAASPAAPRPAAAGLRAGWTFPKADGCPGRLFMVATPIGNALDFSPRARLALESCDLVLAEDTRRTLALCRELGVRVKAVESFHDHNEQEKEPLMLARLQAGQDLALVSDAGTPLVADPGYRLCRACRRQGIAVHPVPGPSAPAAALSAAGIPPLPHCFLGFLPRDEAGRRRLFASFAKVPATLVFFERKDRLKDSLALALDELGPRQACVCRELTKVHEEFILFRLEDPASHPDALLGELTVLVGPPEGAVRSSEAEVREALEAEAMAGGKPKAMARRAAERVAGWSAKEIYALLQTPRGD